jgi:hypothetical protein
MTYRWWDELLLWDQAATYVALGNLLDALNADDIEDTVCESERYNEQDNNTPPQRQRS